jgi:hypothetical protein
LAICQNRCWKVSRKLSSSFCQRTRKTTANK